MKPDQDSAPEQQSEKPKPTEGQAAPLVTDLLPLLRLLTREPPKRHDFKTCLLCKQYGIDRI